MSTKMMTMRNNNIIVLWSISAVVLLAVQLCHSSPVFVQPQFLSGGTGRNIRHLPCVSRRTGEQGVCMFAFTCAKANGTHLGTCIDRFYFGSCCKIDDPSTPLDVFPQDNSIDSDTLPTLSSTSTSTTTSRTTTTTTTKESMDSNDIPGNVDDRLKGTSTNKPTVLPTTQSTKLFTFQTVQNASQQRHTTLPPTTTKSPTSRPASTSASHPSSSSPSKKPTPAPTTFGQRISSKKPASSIASTKKPLPSSSTTVTSSPVKLHRNNATSSTDSTVRPTTQRTYPATRFPPRNATASTTPSTPTTTVKLLPETTLKPTPTKKPAKPLPATSTSTSKRPIASSTWQNTKKPTATSSSKKPATTSSTPAANKATVTTTTISPLTSVKTTTPTLLTPTRKNVTKKPASSAATKKPLTNATLLTKKPSSAPTKKPATTTTSTTSAPRLTTTTTTRRPTTTTPAPLRLTTTIATTVATTTSASSSKLPSSSRPSQLPIATSPIAAIAAATATQPSTTTTKQAAKNATSTTTTTTTTISNEIDAEFDEQTPSSALVTWSSFPSSDDSTTNTPAASSKQPETTQTDWQPITTPDGWIIIQSPTTDQQVQSEVQPVTSATSTTTTISSTTNATKASEATTATTTKTPTPTTTTTTTTESAKTTTTTESVKTTSTQRVTTQPTTYMDMLTTLADVTLAPDFVEQLPADAPLNMTNYKDVCGRRMFPESRIVGGDSSTFGKWPWQISLRQWRTSTYLHKCGAALLNENWAITAAHCVQNVLPSDLLLRIGEHDLGNEDEPYGFQERRVQIVASHPNFDPRTFEFDLALMRFYEPVLPFQPNVLPICVPDDDEDYVGQTAYVTGWGRLYEDGPLPSVLQEVAVPVINNSVCEGMYRNAGYIEHIPNIFICAGWRKGGFDSCEGDSGGPLVIQRKRDKRWVLAGVISWGIGCAEPNQPGVYTRISEFREWINQILQF